ncbi:uncharacterized protein LOC144907958 isoform X2 [Branchiostoma floridae x Branchiostoma belcheri]
MSGTKTGTGQRSALRQGYTAFPVCWCLLVLLSTTTVLGEDTKETFSITVFEGENIKLGEFPYNCTAPPPNSVIWSFKRPEEESYTPQSCPQECGNGCTMRNHIIDLPAVSRTCRGSYQYVTGRDDDGVRWTCTYDLDVQYLPGEVYISNPTPAVFENDSVAMKCQTDDLGNPPATFTSPDFPASGSESTSLTIPYASRTDNGRNFICTLQYEGQRQNGDKVIENYEDTASLTVYYLPTEVTIQGLNNNTTLKEGEEVILNCTFHGFYPRPNITWWKNGEKLAETSETLVLTSLNDKGAYVCETSLNILNQVRWKRSTAVYVNVSTGAGSVGPPSWMIPTALPNTGGLPGYAIGSLAGAGIVLLVIILLVSVICVHKRRNPGRTRGGDQRNGRHNVPYQQNGFQLGQDVRPLLNTGHPNVADQDFSLSSSNMLTTSGGRGQEIIIQCRDANIYQRPCDSVSLKTPSDPSMQLSSLTPTSYPDETSSSVEPRSDTTPKQPPSSDLFSKNDNHDTSDKPENTDSTDMFPTATKVPYQSQDLSSDGYPKTGTSTEDGNPPSSSVSSDPDVTNPKLAADDSDDLEGSSDPRSLHSNLRPPSLPESLDVGLMISLDSENSSTRTNSNPNLQDNANSTGFTMESNNLNKPVNKPVLDKSSAIKNLSESSESTEESIEFEGGSGRDLEAPPPMNEDVNSLREKGDEVAITIDLMLKKVPLKTDHLKLSVAKLTSLYINLSYSGSKINDWKMFAGELGLTVQNVQVIDSCSSQHNRQPAEIVIYHWQRMADRQGSVPCNEQKLRELLTNIGRLDLIAILDGDQ